MNDGWMRHSLQQLNPYLIFAHRKHFHFLTIFQIWWWPCVPNRPLDSAASFGNKLNKDAPFFFSKYSNFFRALWEGIVFMGQGSNTRSSNSHFHPKSQPFPLFCFNKYRINFTKYIKPEQILNKHHVGHSQIIVTCCAGQTHITQKINHWLSSILEWNIHRPVPVHDKSVCGLRQPKIMSPMLANQSWFCAAAKRTGQLSMSPQYYYALSQPNKYNL